MFLVLVLGDLGLELVENLVFLSLVDIVLLFEVDELFLESGERVHESVFLLRQVLDLLGLLNEQLAVLDVLREILLLIPLEEQLRLPDLLGMSLLGSLDLFLARQHFLVPLDALRLVLFLLRLFLLLLLLHLLAHLFYLLVFHLESA